MLEKRLETSNERLAKIIDEKLKAAGLINKTEKQLVNKLAKGELKGSDWKVALEEILNQPKEKK
ncbi:MAG: hypothetical protein IPJ60_02055 [Sphingobacteriaceae bacterium]|nr:hypothetical protein [Sphingobacteriaceae bacterium]